MRSESRLRESPVPYILLRHAETESNARGIWHGATDEPISPMAVEETRNAAMRLRLVSDPRFMRIVSSDLRRAVQTAETIKESLGLSTISLDPLLRERDMGEWAGKSPCDIERQNPGILAAWEQGTVVGPPGGETDYEVAARGLACLKRHAEPRDFLAVVITHGGIIRSIAKSLTGHHSRVAHLAGRWVFLHSNGNFSMGRKIMLGASNLPLT